MNTPAYRGRFAPSPTGPLHFGSLLAAVGSFLDARANHGEWLVRMEDLDPLREMPGAADDILRTLERFGLLWDGEVIYQSQRESAYTRALTQLEQKKLIYPCACTRKETGPVYPGTCRNGLPEGRQARSLRIRVNESNVRFDDLLQGNMEEWLPTQCGDFVVRRADGLYAYQLAVVVDDAARKITHVVRGADLLDSTARQIYLQQCLGLPSPEYLHLPLAINDRGEKLSKQTNAQAINHQAPVILLSLTLGFLGQLTPADNQFEDPSALLAWATKNWRRDRIPRNNAAPSGCTRAPP